MAFIKRGEAQDVVVVKSENKVLVQCKKCRRMIPKGKPCPHCVEDDHGEEE